MTLFRTIPPEVEPVTLAEAKAHLRITHDSEDALVESLLRAAREDVEHRTGQALIVQHWRLALDELPGDGVVALRRGPVREITSVTVYGDDGAASLVDPGTYQLDAAATPARLRFRDIPGAMRAMNGIEIDFVAGFGEAGTDVPDLIKRAVLVLAAHWFEFRAVFGTDAAGVSSPGGFDRLLAPYLPRRLA